MTRALLAIVLLVCSASLRAGGPPVLSPARTMEEAGLVDIRTLVPDLSQDIRYFGSDNFVGARVPVDPGALRDWLGVWRDPWFGEVRLCPVGDAVEWRSAKSPKMHGRVGRLDGRYLLVWDDEAVDENAWLAFSRDGTRKQLHMAKLNPDGDFSSDYEDLAFAWERDCD